MKTILDQDEEVPPFSPVKVTVFVLLLGAIAFAGWRFIRAQSAVAEVAEASKDYRKLFPARSLETSAPPPSSKPVATGEAPASGIGLLKIDDNMRTPKRAPPSAEPPPPAAPQEEAPPVVAPKANRPAPKIFNQPRINSGAFSGLNGGAGIGYTGGAMSGGGAPAPAAPVMPTIPGMPVAPATDKK